MSLKRSPRVEKIVFPFRHRLAWNLELIHFVRENKEQDLFYKSKIWCTFWIELCCQVRKWWVSRLPRLVSSTICLSFRYQSFWDTISFLSIYILNNGLESEKIKRIIFIDNMTDASLECITIVIARWPKRKTSDRLFVPINSNCRIILEIWKVPIIRICPPLFISHNCWYDIPCEIVLCVRYEGEEFAFHHSKSNTSTFRGQIKELPTSKYE